MHGGRLADIGSRMRFVPTLVLLLFSSLLPAQEVEPAWLLEARAERLTERRDFAGAIRLLRQAEQIAPSRGETQLALGRVFKAINDFPIAEDHLVEALALGFESDVDRTLALYDLADIYRTRRDLGQFERTLLSIVELEVVDSDLVVPSGPDELLSDRGLNRFLVLFRTPETSATEARSQLGELYVGLGRYAEAAETLSIAVLHGFTTIIERSRAVDPTYEFIDVATLISRFGEDPQISRYLESGRLYHDLYYLAAAYFGLGDSTSIDLWTLVQEVGDATEWGARARRQVASPRLEPLLIPTR